jgi:MoaA/NifB/PqqE/SkfB family radical SAM enzyme
MDERLEAYLADPVLRRMHDDIRAKGPVRPIQVDLTHACNLRCQGCYFFSEGLDAHRAPKPSEEAEFDAFIEREKARRTNYVTILGGEPSLMLGRLKKVHDNFWGICVTNGVRKIPVEGFESLAIACSVWGDHETDTQLRGGGRQDVFAQGLKNYRDDRRVVWYYTTTAGKPQEIERVVSQIVDNGNFVGFNFYGDIAALGGDVDHRRGFEGVRREVDRMIERYPDRMLYTPYIAEVITNGSLYGDRWGFDVCASLSTDHPKNQERLRNGKPYLHHYRCYNADLTTTRGCCRSDTYDCESCRDTWAHMVWIMVSLEKHLGSQAEFASWLTTNYIFYLTSRIVDFEPGVAFLPAMHARLRELRELRSAHGAAITARESARELDELVLETL